MDRTIVYPGSIPLDTDVLSTNRNVMIALGALAAATLGPGPVVDGLVVVPSGGLTVTVTPGSFTTYGPVDQGAYGSLAADVGDGVVKMGINIAAVTLPLSAPITAGTAVTFLIQATFQEQDVNPVVLPYYNAANPAQPFLGAANNGLAQPTLRAQRVAVQAKAAAPGPSGANPVPTPDPGWVGLAWVTVTNGQTAVTAANIAVYPLPNVLNFKLPGLRPGLSQWAVYTLNDSFTVPTGVARLFVTAIGGGGAGGLHATLPSGGGGGGGTAQGWVYNLPAGTVVPITVGIGGVPPTTPGNGGWGGSSSFGVYLTGTGGQGGYGGTINAVMAGGAGGVAAGGAEAGGSCGTDAIPLAARGGDGGGAGSGRGTSGYITGSGGNAPGAGGGGGGASAPSGAGLGAAGGNGAPGLVIVEF